MDTNTAIVIVAAIFTGAVVMAFMRFGRRGRARLKGPAGLSVDVSGSSDPLPAVKIANAESKEGGALAEDRTGRGAVIDGVVVKNDLVASSTAQRSNDPKA